MYCPNCGKKLNDTDKFCKNCGTRVDTNADDGIRRPPDDDEYASRPLPLKSKLYVPNGKIGKKYKKHPFLIIAFVVIIFVAVGNILNGDSDKKSTKPATTTTQAQKEPQKMFDKNRMYYLSANSMVVKNPEDIYTVEQLSAASDTAGLQAMIRQGKVYANFDRAPCHVISEGFITGYVAILIEGGKNVNKSGYAPIAFIEK